MNNRKKRSPKKYQKSGKIKYWLGIIAVLAVVIIINYHSNQTFGISHYEMDSVKIVEDFRIVHISDLHKIEFGPDNRDLISAVQEQHPDLIAITGDLVQEFDTNIEMCLDFCREMMQIAPVYFCMGNHEGTLEYSKGIPVAERIRELGVITVMNNYVDVELKGNKLRIGSCNDPLAYDDITETVVSEYMKTDDFKLLLVHVPGLFYDSEDYIADESVDLALAGHYHGGQIVIPGLGGLYSQDYGLFPEYSGGFYDRGGNGVLVVSRGLGDAYFDVPLVDFHIPMLRINNKPELIVIDVYGKK